MPAPSVTCCALGLLTVNDSVSDPPAATLAGDTATPVSVGVVVCAAPVVVSPGETALSTRDISNPAENRSRPGRCVISRQNLNANWIMLEPTSRTLPASQAALSPDSAQTPGARERGTCQSCRCIVS